MDGTEITSSCPVDNSSYAGFSRDSINYGGLGGVIAFYVVILGIGLFASWKSKTLTDNTTTEDIMLAGRSIGAFVGIFTMTATWVGGGYINGTAEYVFTEGYGVAWTQAPWGYALSLMLGGLFYAVPMRKARYVTMLDPFEQKYGAVMGALCYIPALLGEIFWSGAILSALGASLTVIIGLRHEYSVIISAAIALLYTLLGGLYSVAFTDVVQLICIAFGLLLAIPFALHHPAVGDIFAPDIVFGVNGTTGWLGKLYPEDPWVGNWLDSALLLIFGGVPWQVYFQRVLSSKTARQAQVMSYLAGVGALLMALPPIFIGAIGKATDWNATDYRYGGQIPFPAQDNKLILPLVMQYLTPIPVAVIGLGAVSAAVMSSADSSVLSCSSMFAQNLYRPFRNAISNCCGKDSKASDREVLWVMRVGIVIAAAAATAMAILVGSIYGLWYLCGDLVYVILFPQLTCVLFLPFANTYGAACGWILGVFFRLTGGEPLLSLPPLIRYPHYDECSGYQLVPFKTISMLISMFTIIVVSGITHLMFTSDCLPPGADIFRCFQEDKKEKKYEANSYTVNEAFEGKDNPNFVEDCELKNPYNSGKYKRTIVY